MKAAPLMAGERPWPGGATHRHNPILEEHHHMGTVTRINRPRKREPAGGYSPLLIPAEVARAFRVEAKTITRWANAGTLRSVRTLGGHRRVFAGRGPPRPGPPPPGAAPGPP